MDRRELLKLSTASVMGMFAGRAASAAEPKPDTNTTPVRELFANAEPTKSALNGQQVARSTSMTIKPEIPEVPPARALGHTVHEFNHGHVQPTLFDAFDDPYVAGDFYTLGYMCVPCTRAVESDVLAKTRQNLKPGTFYPFYRIPYGAWEKDLQTLQNRSDLLWVLAIEKGLTKNLHSHIDTEKIYPHPSKGVVRIASPKLMWDHHKVLMDHRLDQHEQIRVMADAVFHDLLRYVSEEHDATCDRPYIWVERDMTHTSLCMHVLVEDKSMRIKRLGEL